MSSVSPIELKTLSEDSGSLHETVARVDRLTALPPGGAWLIEKIPWIGPRYRSVRLLVRGSVELTEASSRGADVGARALTAFQETGATQPAGADNVTWLDVVKRNEATVNQVFAEISDAQQTFAKVDRSVMPMFAQRKLTELDAEFEQYQQSGLADPSNRQSLLNGLGEDGPSRYLILFQNPAELRPSGGFPGTMALVTFDRGQLTSYEIFDSHSLTDAYIAQRKTKRPEPWPIDHYFPQDGFLLHDTGWYADFPRAASTLMSMYAETDWPSINGVIAVQPSVAADMLQVTGPLDVNIDGEMRNVTAANVYDEIERQRRLIVEGLKPWDQSREVHKEALADIGSAIAERMTSASQAQLIQAAKLLRQSADVRDIQAYAADPAAEHMIDQRGWTGRLQPKPGTPTMAIIFANVALQKSSEFMHPTLTFTTTKIQGNVRTVTMDISVDNTGPTGQNPIYSGFQNWWIEVGLPDGAKRVSSSGGTQPDPEAPNGGSYSVPVNPQQTQHLQIIFTIPADESFTMRRQPGLTDARIVIQDQTCGELNSFVLDRDRQVDLSMTCTP